MTRICPICNYAGDDLDEICPYCGIKLIVRCPACGAPIKTSFAEYCYACGRKFTETVKKRREKKPK
ncbi:MAG: hypothetical protein AMJ46_13540 [Latescibacteria bacterium DG_63]|nr:MAG: hypothetical protein AMJ46_13540 [Latescibacteria bacterium DG_63]